MKFRFDIFFLGLFFSILYPSDLDEITRYIQKVEKGDLNIPYQEIYSYDKIMPDNPLYLYLRALIEIDGDISMEYYKRLYDLYPNHKYADNAAMKIGEYYYSKGLYVQAADWLKKMPVYYPRSEQSQYAVDLFLKSLIIAGKKDTAMFYLKIIKNQMPNVKIKDEYMGMLQSANVKNTPSSIPSVWGKSFYLQIGVYRDYNNARKVRDILNLKGFDSRIQRVSSSNAKLYTVIEGRYPNKELANKASSNIRELLTYDSIVKEHD
ncbi:MAG: hypothetical protein CMG00_03505 [Candidatus Marinimicrobia bacterium]|nr:hypothetical protein [Candidatus Neomarinimicrobiota bacterium]|tara:strand:+ start:1619 stop:2410 length:792 start_codon:yes stop_codon:yes gene_type:complete